MLAVLAMLGICERCTLVVENGSMNVHSSRNCDICLNLCSGCKTNWQE